MFDSADVTLQRLLAKPADLHVLDHPLPQRGCQSFASAVARSCKEAFTSVFGTSSVMRFFSSA